MAETSTCRSCPARVLWIRTSAGKLMPLDVDSGRWLAVGEGAESGVEPRGGSVLRGELADAATVEEIEAAAKATGSRWATFVVNRRAYVLVFTSHFATCPNAGQHRRPR